MKKIVLPPKISKFKKQQKGVIVPIEWKASASRLMFGLYGIQVLKCLRLTLKQLETTRRQISKHLRKSEIFWFRVSLDLPVSKKPNEIRMGKGKGAISFWASRVKSGQILVELGCISLKKAKKIFLAVTKKLPVPCVFLIQQKRI